MRVYAKCAKIATEIAAYVRNLGYLAKIIPPCVTRQRRRPGKSGFHR